MRATDRIAEIGAPELTDIEVVRREDARQVRIALEKLPADQRQVIELAYFEGFTHSQIAGMLELPPGTVKGRMRLGLAKLSGSLGPWVRASGPSPELSDRQFGRCGAAVRGPQSPRWRSETPHL